MTNNGEICFVCPLNVEVLPEDIINSRLAKVSTSIAVVFNLPSL